MLEGQGDFESLIITPTSLGYSHYLSCLPSPHDSILGVNLAVGITEWEHPRFSKQSCAAVLTDTDFCGVHDSALFSLVQRG